MPTELPARREDDVTLPAVPLLVVPACLVALSAFLEADGFSTQVVADVLFRASEALTQGELALLRFKAE
jgi:hypothetical protein